MASHRASDKLDLQLIGTIKDVGIADAFILLQDGTQSFQPAPQHTLANGLQDVEQLGADGADLGHIQLIHTISQPEDLVDHVLDTEVRNVRVFQNNRLAAGLDGDTPDTLRKLCVFGKRFQHLGSCLHDAGSQLQCVGGQNFLLGFAHDDLQIGIVQRLD